MLHFIKTSFINLRTSLKSVGKIFERMDTALYPIIGLPSYEKYIEHFKKTHPDKEPMSRSEFFKSAQDSKAKNVKC